MAHAIRAAIIRKALTSAVPALERLANEIRHQYAITYLLTEGAKPDDRLQVSTTRKNVTVRAPQRARKWD